METDITRESLSERNFTTIGRSVSKLFIEETWVNITVTLGSRVHVDVSYMNDSMLVPNCKTLQQLDSLINLFK